jgi:hypothetical protein
MTYSSYLLHFPLFLLVATLAKHADATIPLMNRYSLHALLASPSRCLISAIGMSKCLARIGFAGACCCGNEARLPTAIRHRKKDHGRKMTSRIAIVPARGGSKRIANKNIRDFCGKPMVAHILDTARGSGLFDVIHVSTESATIQGIVGTSGFGSTFFDPSNSQTTIRRSCRF